MGGNALHLGLHHTIENLGAMESPHLSQDNSLLAQGQDTGEGFIVLKNPHRVGGFAEAPGTRLYERF